MQTLNLLTSNTLINICFISWFLAQLIKTILYWIENKELDVGRLTGSGGMPSSHSSLVVSLTVGIARIEGFESTDFALALTLAAIVMYDAMGVRRAAGEHAKVLNKMLFDFKRFFEFSNDFKHIFEFTKQPLVLDFDEKEDSEGEDGMLKEFLGHTPMEVLGGCLLGILVAISYPI